LRKWEKENRIGDSRREQKKNAEERNEIEIELQYFLIQYNPYNVLSYVSTSTTNILIQLTLTN